MNSLRLSSFSVGVGNCQFIAIDHLHHLFKLPAYMYIIINQGFTEMDSVCIPLVEDTTHASHQEVKVSSSSLREQKLGRVIRTPDVWIITPHRILVYLSHYCCVSSFGFETNHTMMGCMNQTHKGNINSMTRLVSLDIPKLVDGLSASFDTAVMVTPLHVQDGFDVTSKQFEGYHVSWCCRKT